MSLKKDAGIESSLIRPYPILDEDLLQLAGLQPMDLIDLWADEGITFFQYRSKQKPGAARLQEVDRLARRRKLRWILNDYDQLFAEGVADGIHLGWEDWHRLPEGRRLALATRLRDVQPLHKATAPISGISTHTAEQWTEALALHRSGQLPVSYIAFGPCFETMSKTEGKHRTVGSTAIEKVERLRDDAAKKEELPDSVFIGGIDSGRLPELVKSLLPPARKKNQRTVYIASIRALSDPLEIRRFRSIPHWKP